MINRSGFTLIETIVTLAVSVILLFSALSLFGSLTQSHSQTYKAYSLRSVSDDILTHLNRQLNQASFVHITYQQLTVTFTDGSELIYHIEDTNLIELDPETDQSKTLNPPGVKVISFTPLFKSSNPDLPPLIEIQLELHNRAYDQPKESYTAHTIVSLRYHNFQKP